MKVLVDTDVVFDVYEKRQPHYGASNHVLCMARRNTIAAAIASHTLANLFYYYGKPALPLVHERLLESVEVVAADAFLLKAALKWDFADLEDAMDAAAAQTREAVFIISRNVRDFRRSPIPALRPAEFVERFAGACEPGAST
jgi:predicted nucleic acid-binding protein